MNTLGENALTLTLSHCVGEGKNDEGGRGSKIANGAVVMEVA